MGLFSNKKILAVALTSAALLAGCHDDDDAPVPQATVELEGVAVKGAMVDADVVACTFNTACADATTLAAAEAAAGFLAATTTIEGGSYSLTVDATNDPVVIKLFSNANTTQECDYDGCVAAVGEGLTFSTVTFVEESTTPIQAPVNALTTVATTALLDGLGTTGKSQFAVATKASINEALATTSKNTLAGLGVDSTTNLFSTKVKTATTAGLTDATDDEKELSVVNATIGTLADTGETLAAAVTRVSTSVSTFVTTVQSTGEADTTDVAAISTKLATNVTKTATDAGATAPVTTTVTTEAITDLPDLVEDTTGASAGGDSTGA